MLLGPWILEKGILWLYSQTKVNLFKSKELRKSNENAVLKRQSVRTRFVQFKSLPLNLQTSGGSGTTSYKNTINVHFDTDFRYVFGKDFTK